MKKQYDINNPMSPLWLKYPQISRYSIGWRMGYGEDYAVKFGEWYSSLTYDDQKRYQLMFPEPKTWLGWYKDELNDMFNNGIFNWYEDGFIKYSKDKLVDELARGKSFEYIFFWGHQQSKDGTLSTACFSQWWKVDFHVDAYTYCCAEQYMMAEKARLFNDCEIFERIIKSYNPKEIKEFGRKVKNFNDEVWKEKRNSIVLNGNYQKFIQSNDLKHFLLQTEDKIIVEASPFDKIWGIGMSADNKNISDPKKWDGLNLLGFALMDVRDEIRRVCKNENLLISNDED